MNHFISQESLLHDKETKPPKHRFVYIHFVRCCGLLAESPFDGNIATQCEACLNCFGKFVCLQQKYSWINHISTSQIQLFGYNICISYSRKLQYLIYLCHQNTINVNHSFLFNRRTHRIRLIILVNHYLIDVTYSASSMSHCHHTCV